MVDHLSVKPDVSPISIPGLIEKHEGKIIHTPVKPYMPMDEVPFPTYGDKKTYRIIAKNEDKPILLNEDSAVKDNIGCVHIGSGCVF